SLSAFMQYLLQSLMAVMLVTMIFLMVPRAIVAAKRINVVLATEPELADGSRDAANTQGYLEFRNVSFSYPGADEPVPTDISFSAAPGQTIGIIGSTGSGKTTVLNLITRLNDTRAGEVLSDGETEPQYNRAALSQV